MNDNVRRTVLYILDLLDNNQSYFFNGNVYLLLDILRLLLGLPEDEEGDEKSGE